MDLKIDKVIQRKYLVNLNKTIKYKLFVLFITIIISISSYTQTVLKGSTLYYLEGVWDLENKVSNYFYNIYSYYYKLNISVDNNGVYIQKYIVGYLDEGKNHFKDLKDHGRFNEFISMGEFDEKTGEITDIGITNLDFEGKDEGNYDTYTTGNRFNTYFHRVKKAYNLLLFPKIIWQGLLTQEKKDKENYILDFLELDIRKIILPKAELYNQKRKKLNKTLPKDEIVEVLKIEEEWVKINYYINDKETQTVFVKYSTINKKAPIPSFDPSKAKTKIEKAICSNVVLASLDFRMSKLYKKLKKKKIPNLKTTQRNWLNKRTTACENKLGNELVQILKKLYKQRLMELEEM